MMARICVEWFGKKMVLQNATETYNAIICAKITEFLFNSLSLLYKI